MLKRIIMPLLQFCFKNSTYTIQNGLAKGLKRRGGLGFVSQVFPLTEEEKFLINLNLTSQTVYDIGGYIGVTTLFFSKAVGENGNVITFEPNPKNYNKILENINLNNFSNVKAYQTAIGKNEENANLVFCQTGTGSGSIQKEIKSKIVSNRKSTSIEVQVNSLDNLIKIHKLPAPDFVKIDVEGSEIDVILGMHEIIKRFKPKLFIEIHGIDEMKKKENIKEVVHILKTSGYSIYHIESKETIDTSNSSIAFKGHIYCI